MKLTLQIQLLPDATQKPILLSTMERFNQAASHAAQVGFEAGVISQPSIHQRCYREIRERFGLSSQMAVRAIGKAVEAFAALKARGRKECPVFRPRGAVTYDERILGFKGPDKVSLWTLTGRMILPLIHGAYQGERIDRRQGQCDLIYREGKFYLYVSVDMPEDAPIEVEDLIGVDMGLVNIATTSDGDNHSGEDVERTRRRHHRNRQRLQKKGTRGAKKRLKKLAGREARFRKHVNHRISKAIVTRAKDTGRGIAVEELGGIRDRITVRARDRARHSGWSFFQLRSFLTYKAALAGVPVVAVDPRDTSRRCSACGYTDKANRKTRDTFVCLHCGHASDADLNASLNIRDRGLSKRPSKLAVSDRGSNPRETSRKSPPLRSGEA